MDAHLQRRTERAIRAMAHTLLQTAPGAIEQAAAEGYRPATLALLEAIDRIELIRSDPAVDPRVRTHLAALLPTARGIAADRLHGRDDVSRHLADPRWRWAADRCTALGAVPVGPGSRVWPD